MIQFIGRSFLSRLGSQVAAFSSKSVAATNAWNSVAIPEKTLKDIPTSTGGAAFPGDIRATSGLGKGDGIKDHTGKWLQGGKSPMQYISEAEPILVEGPVVASHGSE
jgi:NADH dehydrogenase (ubiquinone) Fe-S protein 6